MIVGKEQLHEFLNGETDEIRMKRGDPPPVGSFHALQAVVGRKATCRVRVLDAWRHRDGGFVVRVELATEDVPRLLGAKGGYTSDPRHALRDSTAPTPQSTDKGNVGLPHPDIAPPRELEGVPAEVEDEFAKAAKRRDDARAEEREAEELDVRVRKLMEAQARGVDVSRQLAAINRRVQAAERKLGRRAA